MRQRDFKRNYSSRLQIFSTYSLTNSHIGAYQRNDSHKYFILDFSCIPYQMVNKKPPHTAGPKMGPSERLKSRASRGPSNNHQTAAVQPVADSGESVAVVTGCLPLNLFCLFPFSVLPPFSVFCLTDIPSVVVSLFAGVAARWLGIWRGVEIWPDLLSMEDDCALVVVLRSSLIPPASVSWCQRQSRFWVSDELPGGGDDSLLVVFPCTWMQGSLWLEGSGSQCLSLVRVNVVLGCCSLPSSSFPVTASVASISVVRVLVLWFLPCGVSSFYRAGSGGSGGFIIH
ncbi:hypothetical protein F2Q70_00044489 [Brassica cretica]|uniref:Uncharacterized protein n=1 Tax=Brassica cretica TaxID=69181 RepID=A0A8S9KKY9_BRACR|nr:hypothetical protein F2Q70_00044489 [Brassica cretica]